VLVAIISAVVMGMTGNVGQTYTVGVKVVNNDSNTIVTITGGDYNKMSKYYVVNAEGQEVNKTDAIAVGVPFGYTKRTGETTIVGTFSTGNQTIWSGTLN
ncbi:MAG: hypothetical protein Q4Q53_01100, partial [Methanocorpusculum sp.]|nr:hypothetical protein [Methanocorpusculum sp.]